MLSLIAAATLGASVPTHLDPLDFFSGHSHGVGTIWIVFKGTQPLRVTSSGRPDGHGGIILDQTIRRGSEPPKNRSWNLRSTSPTTLTGTLSDASGPVTGTVSATTLTLDYPMKGYLRASQSLILQPGGRVLLNHMTVSIFGFTVATVDERITKD